MYLLLKLFKLIKVANSQGFFYLSNFYVIKLISQPPTSRLCCGAPDWGCQENEGGYWGTGTKDYPKTVLHEKTFLNWRPLLHIWACYQAESLDQSRIWLKIRRIREMTFLCDLQKSCWHIMCSNNSKTQCFSVSEKRKLFQWHEFLTILQINVLKGVEMDVRPFWLFHHVGPSLVWALGTAWDSNQQVKGWTLNSVALHIEHLRVLLCTQDLW